MQNDSRATAYWEVEVEDGHYLSSDPATYVRDTSAGTLNLGQDWFIEEDDIERSDPLCTPPDSSESWGNLEPSYFACKEIHCEMRRIFNTSDNYDLDFITDGTAETMEIAAGAAKL